MSNVPNLPKKRGCFFYGCLTMTILALLGGVLGYVGYRVFKSSTQKFITVYTDTQPVLLEYEEVSPAQLAALKWRLTAFDEALKQQTFAQELVLTASDINALIADNSKLKGKLFVMIEGDRIKGKVSLPLDNIGPLHLKNRYLNGMASFKTVLMNDVLVVTMDDVQVKGQPLPAILLAALKGKNLAQDALRDPQVAEKIRKFESLQIKDGKVILKNKMKQP